MVQITQKIKKDGAGNGMNEEKRTSMHNQFEVELETLLNRYSKENESDTPDYVLAHYIKYSLKAYNQAVNLREEYYGRKENNLS